MSGGREAGCCRAVHEHEFLRGLRDAGVGEQPRRLARLTGTVFGLGHGDLSDHAADQHGHDDEQQPPAERGDPVTCAPAAERGGEIEMAGHDLIQRAPAGGQLEDKATDAEDRRPDRALTRRSHP